MNHIIQPVVSIIMPYYRGRAYLKQAIESIRRQTLHDWELIIVAEEDHDGEDILERMSREDRRIKVCINPGPRGISVSLNHGLRQAKGSYIARMDADDIAEPVRLQLQAEFLEAHPEILLCGSATEEFGGGTTGWELEHDPAQMATDILFYSPCVHPTVMFRRNVIEEHGIRYREEYKASEDYAFFSEICRVGKVSNLRDVLLRYRVTNSNATHTQAEEGVQRYLEVMEEQFREMGLIFSRQELELLCVHVGLKGMQGEAVLDALTTMDLLLKRILAANERRQRYDREYLFQTLHKRYTQALQSLSWCCRKYDRSAVDELSKRSIFRFERFYQPIEVCVDAPIISVLLPTYQSEDYIADTVWSILAQTETRFELLLLNEAGSDDNTVILAQMFQDPRVKIIQNRQRLGLAESLNQGIRLARGVYLARADADDLYDPQRFEKQLAYMEAHPKCGVCGTWQHHFGRQRDWNHCPPVEHEDIRASLIFNCELCHSTLMLRKDVFEHHNLFYDNSYAAEDYELWTRAVHLTGFHNIPEILGEYRWNGQNITQAKMKELSEESARLAARNLEQYLAIEVPAAHEPNLNGWRNEIAAAAADGFERYQSALRQEHDLLWKIWQTNQQKGVYQLDALEKTLIRRWSMVLGCTVYGGKVQGRLSLERMLNGVRYARVFYMIARIKMQLKRLLGRG